MAAARSGGASAGADGPDVPTKRVQAGDSWIEYRIRRSRQRKKTYQISVKSGEVVVAVPHRTTNRQAEEMVLQKAKWILSKLAVGEPEPAAPRFLSGEKLPFCGRELTLWVEGVAATDAGGLQVYLDGRRLKVAVPVGMAEEVRQERVGQAISAWYGEQAAEQVWQHVQHWWPVLGRDDGPSVQIRNQRRRWGSCSHDGVLRFNWRLAMLEPALIEYVVVHELAHLTPHEPLRQLLGAGGPTPARHEGAAAAFEASGDEPAAVVTLTRQPHAAHSPYCAHPGPVEQGNRALKLMSC